MAIAKVEITCKDCGRTFTHRKECYNRREAEEYEAWAIRNIDTCLGCKKKAMDAQQMESLDAILTKYGAQLPAINGVSEKQIKYAEDMRIRYLASELGKVEKYCRVMQTLNDPERAAKFAGICSENGITVEDAIRQSMQAMYLDKVMLMMTETEARMILDKK